MASNYEVLLFQANEELAAFSFTTKKEMSEIQSNMEMNYVEAHVLLLRIKNSLQENYEKVKSSGEDIPVSTKRFCDAYWSDIESALAKGDDFINRSTNAIDKYKKEKQLLNKIKFLEFLISNNHKVDDKLLSLTNGISAKKTTEQNKNRLLAFLDENKGDVPIYLREYIETWLQEDN